MGKIDKLLDALAQRLPSTADRKVLVAALRAAAQQLPDAQAKTRTLLLKTESACIKKLELRVRAIAAAEHDVSEEDGAQEELDIAKPGDVVAGYAGFSSQDPLACLAQCSELLRNALTSIRPSYRAQQAIEGLLALVPPETVLSESSDPCSFGVGGLQACANLVTPAVALLRGSDDTETAVWHRFLGFLLVAPLRLKEEDHSGVGKVEDVIHQLGGLVALVASPQAARSALRLALSSVGSAPSDMALTRFAPVVFPIVSVAFGRGALDGVALVRGDLVALLHAVRLVGVCSSMRVSPEQDLDEARGLLRLVLAGHFDAALLLPELQRLLARNAGALARSKVLQRRLAAASGGERNRVAAAVVETVEALGAVVTPLCISRLAESCGLRVGEDERVDQRAAAARAQGDIFFEDVAGFGDDSVVTKRRAKGAAAASAAHLHSVGRLDGVESLASPAGKSKRRILSKRPLLQEMSETGEQNDGAQKKTKGGAKVPDAEVPNHGQGARSGVSIDASGTKRQRKQ